MPLKEFELPQVGKVIVSKRRGAKNIRLSINSTGQVRVSIPTWVPYAAGLSFAKNRQAWIISKKSSPAAELSDGDRIGKSHRLKFVRSTSSRTSTSLQPNLAIVRVGKNEHPTKVQEAAVRVAQKALKTEAEQLLPIRLKQLASKYGFKYKQVKIKRLTSRWGSCSSDKVISLSYYLMQVPWELIDYVILHELTHTQHLNHSPDFWSRLEEVSPNARKHRKWIKNHRPIVVGSK